MCEHRTAKMRKGISMKFLCIISGCPAEAWKWHISFLHRKKQFFAADLGKEQA